MSESLSFSATELVDAATRWFGSLQVWPQDTVVEMGRTFHAHKAESAEYYGVQAMLLMLASVNNGRWPPISPRRFADDLHHVTDQIERYARTVNVVDRLRTTVDDAAEKYYRNEREPSASS